MLALLLLGLGGTATELLLMGHYESAWQMVPLVLIGVALVSVGWQLVRPNAAKPAHLRIVMIACVVTSLAGLVLHYRGNRQYQLEFDPTQHGVALFWKVIRAKAPPALAPGVMAQLGMLGLIYAYRHPAADRAQADTSTTKGE